MSAEWKSEVSKLVDRYSQMTESLELREFCSKLVAEINQHPEIKTSRWLGYIQGRVIAEGKTTVAAERDYTRPILAPLENKLKIYGLREAVEFYKNRPSDSVFRLNDESKDAAQIIFEAARAQLAAQGE